MMNNFHLKEEKTLVKKFKNLHTLKEQIENEEFSCNVNPTHYPILSIYHTIETEKMNAADMYNVMKALQYQLIQQEEFIKDKKKKGTQKHFDDMGGIKLYIALKNYLTDIGVNVHEIN